MAGAARSGKVDGQVHIDMGTCITRPLSNSAKACRPEAQGGGLPPNGWVGEGKGLGE